MSLKKDQIMERFGMGHLKVITLSLMRADISLQVIMVV